MEFTGPGPRLGPDAQPRRARDLADRGPALQPRLQAELLADDAA